MRPSRTPSVRFAMVLALSLTFALPTLAVVPDQFIAKLYTEGLGRIPDPSGWNGQVSYFTANGCSVTTTRAQAASVFGSAEFNGFGYDNESKLLALFRAAFSREPDPTTFNAYLAQLNGGTPWSTVVANLLNSAEFTTATNNIHCGLVSYGWGAQPVMNLTPGAVGDFAGGTGAQLQALLNAARPSGTVRLKQKSVTRLTTPLVIPSGVTLTTYGVTNRKHYAKMGRLVRDSAFNSEMVTVQPGGRMTYVWVDGTRNSAANFTSDAIDVRMHGFYSGSYAGSLVADSRLSNSRGWSTLQSVGWGYTCNGHTVRNNLVTAYSSSHTGGYWTDGLSIACENALVEDNDILDATDVPIVLFRSDNYTQTSTIRDNWILNAGNSAYGGLVVDPLHTTGLSYSFAGSSVTANTMWTGSRVHWDIGISVGTKAWFGTNADAAWGPSVTQNTTAGIRSRVDIGIAVSRAYSVNVLNNNLLITQVNSDPDCPNQNVIAAVSAGDASGTIQTYTDAIVPHCIGH